MAEEIVRLSAADFDEAMAMLRSAFSKTHEFPELLPALYQRTDDHMSWNHTIRREGRIAAIVGIFPITWKVGDTHLKVAGIGGVGTCPHWRGHGLMRRLMQHARDHISRKGYHLSFLGGQRQRYRYFGWERAGTQIEYLVSPKNMEHEFRRMDSPSLTLEPISEDPEILASAKRLHDGQPAYCRRTTKAFGRYLRNWGGRPLVARDAQSRVTGYLVARGDDGIVDEWVSDREETALDMARQWIETTQKITRFNYPTIPPPLHHKLGGIAERITVEASGNWQIFNWPATVNALLRLRHATTPLAEGAIRVRIDNVGVTLALRVEGTRASCRVTNDPPDWSSDANCVLRVLFGPTPPSSVADLPKAADTLASWCPLPLALPNSDHV